MDDVDLTLDPDLPALADLWRWCAEENYADSPLYVAIASRVAEDPELIGLTVEAGTAHARFPNVLMAAVHELVLLDRAPALAEVYAGRSDADPFPLFRAAALDHRHDLLPRLATQFTNTNEVGRSAILVPALAHVARDWPAWALVEAGCSAGLNLCFDRYHLDYGRSGSLGDPASPVRATCVDRTGAVPLPATMPEPAARVGLDRNPIDLTDPDERRWLLACTWPDSARMARTDAAHALVAADPPDLVRGDIVADLPALLAATAPDLPVVVLTTWVVSYLAPADRAALDRLLAEASARRPVAWVSADAVGVVDVGPTEAHAGNVLGVVRYEDGARADAEVLADAHHHGGWIEWRATTAPTGAGGAPGR